MALQKFNEYLFPILRFCGDEKDHSIREIREALTKEFHLTQEDLESRYESGYLIFENRSSWALTYLKQAGLLFSPKRGVIRITERGKDVLKQNPTSLDHKFLMKFKEFQDFWTRSSRASNDSESKVRVENEIKDKVPDEQIEYGYSFRRRVIENEILDKLKKLEPEILEKVVVNVLLKLGYGGGREISGTVLGKKGDEGIDGVINEDYLGLDKVYIQAKKWEGTVGRPEIQKFAGALQGRGAKKGVFITTSSYSKEAIDYVAHLENKIVLIDGERLASLMFDQGVGVRTKKVYEIKEIDLDYFENEGGGG